MTGNQFLIYAGASLFVLLWALDAQGQDAPANPFPPSVWEVEHHAGQTCPFMTLRVANGCGDQDRLETVASDHGDIRLGYDMRGGCYQVGGKDAVPDVVKVIAVPDGVEVIPDRRLELLEDGDVREVLFCAEMVGM